MNKTPLVSIIIVNYNGEKYLERCFSSIMKNNYPRYEVILVDNNSSDSSVHFIQKNFPDVIIIQLDKNLGFAEPNNIGAQKAKGDYLLFLNNDTMPTVNFISELVDAIQANSKIAICQSLLLKPGGEIDSSGDFVDTLGRAYSSRIQSNDCIVPILSARGASMLVRKNVFWDLGGFDKNFFASFEDVDLGWKAWILGHEVVLAPRSIVYHVGGKTIQKLGSIIQFHGVKNSLILRLCNLETSFAIRCIVILFFVTLMRKTFGFQIIKDPEQSPPLPSVKVMLRGLLWILKNFKYVVKKRQNIKSKRVRSTKELIRMKLITR